uniref:Reverse transcriptase domain-containing protein n=1 Tax=Syphacia muris TaxID=451379 RepID=A0A0N5ALP5_9BILA
MAEEEVPGPRFLGFEGEDAEIMEGKTISSALFTIYHQPVTVCRTLVQFGYNPLPLYTPFSRRYRFSRGFFSYARHLIHFYGVRSLWTGLEVALVRAMIYTGTQQFLFRSLEEYLPNFGGALKIVANGPRTIWERCQLCFRVIIRNSLVVIPLDLIIYPFHVILNRKIAQIIVGDFGYDGIFDSASLVYNREGLKGFFAGFHPFLLCTLMEIVLTNSVILGIDIFFCHCLKKYCNYDEHNYIRDLGEHILNSLTSLITYPYNLVSTICSIAIFGEPPFNFKWGHKTYRCRDWVQLKHTLQQSKVQYRGIALLVRPYTGPVIPGLDGNLYEAHI